MAIAKPEIVCLCGSTRFIDAFRIANEAFTIKGKIVLTVGFFGTRTSANDLQIDPELKAQLDELHLRKIDLADSVYFINVDGYIGDSTRRELAYAISRSKRIEFWLPEAGESFMSRCAHELGKLVAEFTTKKD